ncbi:MAG: FGGY-family carbohydrate kinase [Hungatella sp.]|jgi:sugar (pentulose or hexulose) kinase|nr:FGGY-family carbohydrate kinase [Hungatella sp.]
MDDKKLIESGDALLGIEFGSTRIKAQLINQDGTPLAVGSFDWENDLKDGYWTYGLDKITNGLKSCYSSLADDIYQKYDLRLKRVKGIGISAMMHGYLALDGEGRLLVPFRTWRNSTAASAAEKLTELFDFNIPERWSISHLYQVLLDKEEHTDKIHYITTLAGYIHYRLTGEKVLGIGDASGMFPIDSSTLNYDENLLEKFSSLAEVKACSWNIKDIFPKVRIAGEVCGTLTLDGAALLDESGNLEKGIPLCAPEGDAGTGMVATNSVAVRTCNVSAGTSIFAMIVLEKSLSRLHREIDMVTTPSGHAVAMVHANNCTSDLNAWVNLFREYTESLGVKRSRNEIYETLYRKALEGESDCGELLSYGYLSGEYITGLAQGRPLFMRTPESRFTLANFMRSHLYSSIAALKIGMDILTKDEQVKLDRVLGHGGLFKTKEVGQSFMADALETKVTVMENAGEGGPWGMALLALYMADRTQGQTLEDFLSVRIFGKDEGYTVAPDPQNSAGFEKYIENYIKGLTIEKKAAEVL